MNFSYDTFPTPVGIFSAAVDESGALVATAFGDLAALQARITRVHRAAAFHHDPSRLHAIRSAVAAYFAGKKFSFASLPLAAIGSPFQQRVWTALCAIPHGETRSYRDLAHFLKTSARAVGRANATNPICLIIPCHRVIGADGSLTGFAFGEELKRQLLEHEGWQDPVGAASR